MRDVLTYDNVRVVGEVGGGKKRAVNANPLLAKLLPGNDKAAEQMAERGLYGNSQDAYSINDAIKSRYNRWRRDARYEYNTAGLFNKAVNEVVNQVVGVEGIRLRPIPMRGNPPAVNSDMAEKVVESWLEWHDEADVARVVDFVHFQRSVIIELALSGEALFLVHRHPAEKYGISLQQVDAAAIDITKTTEIPRSTNKVILGVEINEVGRPMAYHFRLQGKTPMALPAFTPKGVDEVSVLHLFLHEFPGQLRGMPMVRPSLGAWQDLDDYNDAVKDAAIAQAQNIAAITLGETNVGPGYDADDGEPKPDNPLGKVREYDRHTKAIEVPYGGKVESMNSTQPAGTHQSFSQLQLREAISSLGVGYAEVSSDYSAINFSAGRMSQLMQRDNWRRLQDVLIKGFVRPLYREWLWLSLPNGRENGIPLQYRETDKVVFVGRKWDFVQPREQAMAAKIFLDLGVKSHQEVIRELGGDPDATLKEQIEWKTQREELGLASQPQTQETNEDEDAPNPDEEDADEQQLQATGT